jgi:hypothetical protein
MFDSDCDSGGGAGQENGERPSLGVTIRSSRPHTPALPNSVTAVQFLGLRKSHRTGLIRAAPGQQTAQSGLACVLCLYGKKYSICLSTWDFGLLAACKAFLGYIPDTSA